MTQFLIVACSGGADSMFLLHTAMQTGKQVVCAHVEHGLRGQASLRDQAFVRDFAHKHSLLFETVSLTPPAGGNFENWARAQRYQWLQSLCARYPDAEIWTGHHADDQAESVALAILRRSGIPGLAGIAPVQGNIYRPLLSVTKHEIVTQCECLHIPFVHDETNDSLKYARNRVRHILLPLVSLRIPDARERLCRIADRARAELVFQESRARQCVATLGEEHFLFVVLTLDPQVQLWWLRQIFGWYLSQSQQFLTECACRKKGDNLHFGPVLFRHVGSGVRILRRNDKNAP